MFVGQYAYTLDSKKRLVIPAKFRLTLSDKPVLEEDYHLFVTLKSESYQNVVTHHLEIYPPETWKEYFEWLNDLAKQSEEARWYLRKISSDTELCKVDPQWRILIPLRLINGAELKRDIMIIGGGKHIQVWEREKWNMVSVWLDNQAPTLAKYVYKP
ncbi:MAG: hypothetical protein QME51_02060 [Planctomycetota bacterium]|nr:hypothetical protein [Planctomycetota bacterium]MDI6787137.1 hypothetical protein [Planctomycetota bacterium]